VRRGRGGERDKGAQEREEERGRGAGSWYNGHQMDNTGYLSVSAILADIFFFLFFPLSVWANPRLNPVRKPGQVVEGIPVSRSGQRWLSDSKEELCWLGCILGISSDSRPINL